MIFVSLVIFSLTSFCFAFNIDEINSVYYDIDILGKPVVKQKFDEDVMLMVNRMGQEYACSLPTIPSDLKGQGSKDDSAAHEDSVDISGLLKPMEAAPCLVTTKDWWTYEFCYGHVIKQYHLEDGKSSGVELILGKYESEYDWSNGGKGGADASAIGNSNRLQRFHSQFYTNGTKCDLTGEPRKAEVRFKCESDIGDFIERVDEPESCRYIVTVATSKVCHHPYLRPHPDRTPHHIRCSPVLSPERFTQYTSLQEKKRKIADEASSAAQESTQPDADEDQISIEVINFGESFTSNQHKELLDTAGSSLSSQPSLPDGEDNASQSSPEAAEEGGAEAAVDADTDATMDEEQGTDDQKDFSVEEEKILKIIEDATGKDKKKTSLDKFIEQFGERLTQATSGDVASNIAKVREQLSENTAELQGLLEETLADLERELVVLADMAKLNGETAKLGLWRMLITKVRALQTKTEMLSIERRPDPEPERGSLEWSQWRLKKNQKTISKAQETLSNVSDMKKLLTKKASVIDSAAEASRLEKKKKEEEKEEDNFMNLFSGQFVDELLEQYVADQDAGSKEGEAVADKMDKPNEFGDADEHSVMIGSLQESIKDKLKKSGLDVNKHKIEVKILTPGALMDFRSGEEEKISAEQAHSVETLVIKLMGAQKEEIIEKQKHESLSENYNFSFDESEDDASSPSLGTEKPSSADTEGTDDSTGAGEG